MLPFLTEIASFLGFIDRASTAVTKAGRFRKDWHDARQVDKQAAARWLAKVADCLSDIRAAIADDRPPAGAAVKLNAYAAAIPATVESLLMKHRAKALQRRLRALHDAARASDAPKGWTEAQRAKVLADLEAAAAECQALADFAEAN